MTYLISLPYAVLLIMDPSSGEPPETMGQSLISATDTCVAVGTRPDADGPVEIALVSTKTPVGAEYLQVFKDRILTPARKLALVNALNETLLSVEVADEDILLEVWVDSTHEPSKVIVRFDR